MDRREEMNALIYLVRGGGQNILINTGPPQDLTVINNAWLSFFGYPEAQIVRSEDQLPQNILRTQGLTLTTSHGDRHPLAGIRHGEHSHVSQCDGRDFSTRLD